MKGGGRSPDNDLSKDGHQYVHRIKSINVSTNTIQSLIHRDSYLACVVVLLFWQEGKKKRTKGKGGEMPSFVMSTPLADSA